MKFCSNCKYGSSELFEMPCTDCVKLGGHALWEPRDPAPDPDYEIPAPQTNRQDDPVNHPNHYTQGGVECIDAIKASMTPEAFKGYLKGNAIKYLWRYLNKGKPVQDLEKARWYLDKLIEEEVTP